jgi:hypothetical protein
MAMPLSIDFRTIAASQERETIKDYFLALPAQYLSSCPSSSIRSKRDRERILAQSSIDIDNGYLKTNSDTCYHELAIFKRNSGKPLVVVNTRTTVYDSIAIVDPDRRWQDVTKQVFPVKLLKPDPEKMSPTIQLPRQGKVITIETGNGQTRWQVKFKGGKFQITKP